MTIRHALLAARSFVSFLFSGGGRGVAAARTIRIESLFSSTITLAWPRAADSTSTRQQGDSLEPLIGWQPALLAPTPFRYRFGLVSSLLRINRENL
jgi:hypothetical protein